MRKVVSFFLTLLLVCNIFVSIKIEAKAASGSAIVAYAREYLGYPYDKGTQGPNSFDCSGFVQYVFKHFGIYLPAGTDEYDSNPWNYGTVIDTNSTANAVAGDIISWQGHVAIYTGNGYCIEALNYKYGVGEFRVDAHPTMGSYNVIRVYGVENHTSKPKAPTVSLSKNILKVNEKTMLYWSNCEGADYYWVSCWSETDQCISEKATAMSKQISFSKPGKYSITVVSGNALGETIGNWIEIYVYNTDGYNILQYNANGGTGNMNAQLVYYDSKFSTQKSTFSRKGYEQKGWNIYRCSDKKWFVPNKGWKTEKEIIENSWIKQVYTDPIQNWTFDQSWYNGGILNDTIIFYAVWKKVPVVEVEVVEPPQFDSDIFDLVGPTPHPFFPDNWQDIELPQLRCGKPNLRTISNTRDGLKITWDELEAADTYVVYRKTKNGEWKCLGETGKNSYTDKTVKSGKKYYYTVSARNEAGDSDLSNALAKQYLFAPILIKCQKEGNNMSLAWIKTKGAKGYIIYRKTASGKYKKLKIVKGMSNNSYTDKTAFGKKRYFYKVKAYKGKTHSAFSKRVTSLRKW